MGFVISPLFGLWMYENVDFMDGAAPFIFCTGLVIAMAIYAFFTAPKDTGGRHDAIKDAVAKDKPPE